MVVVKNKIATSSGNFENPLAVSLKFPSHGNVLCGRGSKKTDDVYTTLENGREGLLSSEK